MGMDFSLILQNQATSVVLLDHGLRIVYLNESAESLINASRKQSTGLSIDELVCDSQLLIGACNKVLEDGGEIRLRDHLLKLPVSFHDKQVSSVVSYFEAAGQPMVMLEMIEIESIGKIARDEEFIQRQQSNQAVIKGLAHEIRNPLGGIRGAAQLLSEEAGSDDFGDYTRIIIREADRLTALVDRMQAKTRVDINQSINIHRLIEHVRQLTLADGSRQFSIVSDYDPSLPAIRGNADLLIQALLNVIRNATDAVEPKGEQGRILIRTRIDRLAIEGDRKQVVRIDIVDNGDGVDPDLEHRIFDPMVTNKAEGTGLGLPITAEIITQHKGALDFNSKQGETVFRLYLPVIDAGDAGESGDSELPTQSDPTANIELTAQSIYGVSA